ncbi:MAG: hypothetical protein ACK5NT_06380 [Pyrinomonadaceae bacterium]
MKTKYIIALAAFVLFSAASSFAQGNIKDYSGTWNLNKDKSELGERNPIEDMTQTVTQDSEKITVERDVKVAERPGGNGDGNRGTRGGGRGMLGGSDTYTLDGKPVKEETERGTLTRKAKNNDGKLELTQEREFNGPMGTMKMKTTETWTLSSDGKVLTITSETESPRGSRKATLVFNKAEK